MHKVLNILLSLKEYFFPDKKFRRSRIWSNQELKNFSHLFNGSVINVSGWKDSDKRGDFYKNYFSNASSYTISNYEGPSGMQGENKNEIFINLEENLQNQYILNYDVVFNHTTLEHVYEFQKAFQNLCLMTKDILIIVVPFMQQQHAIKDDYDDYWRFTPYAIKKMVEKNGLHLLYLSANNKKSESIYIFAIASKFPEKWNEKIKPVDRQLFEKLGEKIVH